MTDTDDALDLEQFLDLLGTRVEEKAQEDALVVTREGATWHFKSAQVRIERLAQPNATGDIALVRTTPSGVGGGAPVPFWCKRSSIESVATGITNFFYWLDIG
jgi:hypothetical protein